MLLWQQRALECAAGPQFAVGHSRTSRYSGRYSSRYSSHYSSHYSTRYSRREFASLKRFLVGNLRVLKDKKGIFLSSQSQVHEYL